MPEEIEFLRTLGDDLRAAAAEHTTSRWRDRRLLAIAPIALVGLVVAAVVVIPSLFHTSTAPAPPAHPHPSPTAPVLNSLGGPAPVQIGPELAAVAATGPDDLWAVGDRSEPRAPDPISLILHFNGSSWTSSQAPNISSLTGVTALAPDDAWAVGQGRKVLHWNGTAWAKMMLPNVPGMQVMAVSGSGPDDVWIVGSRFGHLFRKSNSIANRSLAMHWNGSSWSVIPTPYLARGSSSLAGVVALSPTDAWAVGDIGGRPLAIHWDGTNWRRTASPALPTHHRGELDSIGTDGQGGVWAVGRSGGPGYGGSLYERWTGSNWHVAPSPGPLTQTPAASVMSGSSSTDMWAVGNPCCGRYVMARYQNNGWHDITIAFPGVSRYEVTLDGVSTLSSTDAWAVGSAGLPEPTTKPHTATREVVILHWDGRTWNPVAVPNVASLAAS